jgi:hypothetical protein
VIPVAFGEPSWQMNVDGRWDVVPLVIAAVALLLLRVVLRVRLTPIVVIGVVLAAPLFRALADRTGFPRAVAAALAFGALVAIAIRMPRRGGAAGSDV